MSTTSRRHDIRKSTPPTVVETSRGRPGPGEPRPTAATVMARVIACLAVAASLGLVTDATAQMTVELSPVQDTTIFAEADLSNGAGVYMFCGPNNRGDERRALLAFDIAGAVPAGSTISSVELQLQMNKTLSGNQTVGLHRVLAEWGEAGSDAPGQEGAGTAAANGDATWNHRFFPDQMWTAMGGDFSAAASAEQQVGGVGTYTWGSTSQMVADVQGWLDQPDDSFGWILVQSTSGTAKRFATRENQSNPPLLRVTYTLGQTELDNRYFVAAAARGGGAQGSFFLTDLDVMNGGSETATYRLLWLPRGADNSSPTMSAELTLEPGEAIRHADVLQSIFGFTDDAFGALGIVSDSADLQLMSRTFNSPGDGGAGTFGQSIPGQRSDRLIPAGERRRILFFTENDDYRSNLGLLNGTDSMLTVNWERFDADGSSLGTGSRSLQPWSNTQINRIFSDNIPTEAAYVEVWTDTTGGLFSAYGSVLDNVSSDPTTVLPE